MDSLRGLWLRLVLIGATLMVGLVAMACGADPTPTATPRPTATPVPPAPVPTAVAVVVANPFAGLIDLRDSNAKSGGMWNLGCVSEAAHYDPIQSATGANSFPQLAVDARLVRFSPVDASTVIPELAESWDVSTDGKVYTFHLRAGLTFHNGDPITAEDVKASYDRIINPPDSVASVRKTAFRHVTSIDVLDSSTVTFTLSEPRGLFLKTVAMGWNLVVPKSVLEANDYSLRKIDDYPSAGPFKFKSHQVGEQWVVERFDDYYKDGQPYLDGLTCFKFTGWGGPEETAGVLSGRLDGAIQTAAESAAKVRAGDYPGIKIMETFSPFHNGLYMNAAKGGPLADTLVRRAIHLVTNRQAHQAVNARFRVFRIGSYIHSVSPFARTNAEVLSQPGFRADKTADIARAKELMIEAGYPDGFAVEYLVRGESPAERASAIAWQDELKQLNIDVTLRTADSSRWFEEVREGRFEMAKGGAGWTIDDPEDAFTTCCHPDSATNYSKYSNDEVVALLDRLGSAVSFEERNRLGREILNILEYEIPFVIEAYQSQQFMYWDYVKGLPNVGMNLYNTGNWDTVWLDK
jgi:peptide/nickel transport system substrate-binding protein